VVKTLGDEFLARPSLSDYQHRPIERCSAARPLDGIEESQTLADELICSLHTPTVGGKSHHLASIFNVFGDRKSGESRKIELSENVARMLLGYEQV
jgi:hypothetical protein